MIRKLIAATAIIFASLFVHDAAPADAHVMGAYPTYAADSFSGCSTHTYYYTFGNSISEMMFTSGGCNLWSTQVGVQTAHNGQAWTAWCSAGSASFTPTQWCYWVDNDPLTLRAVAPGTAFGVELWLVVGSNVSHRTHGAFG